MTEKINRTITDKNKKLTLIKQNNRCANFPNSYAVYQYECLLWKYQNGFFDDAYCEFDHIDGFSLTKNNDINNIQALCPNCHAVKTRIFMQNKKIFTTKQLGNGAGLMDVT
jgi:5-methylcytosine-specific restriction endonuclease McrA